MDEALENQWQELSKEILTGMKDWRQVHPEATFREIEEAVHTRISRLEAFMVQETALASEKTDWGKDPAEKRPKCPNCGAALQPRGRHTRDLQGQGGERIRLSRSYGTCPQCGMGLFPPR